MAENSTVVDPFYTQVYDWTKHGLSIFVSISFLLGVPGNSLVVMVHTRIKDKSVTDWMIFYVAVCDILSLINVPQISLFQLEFCVHGIVFLLCNHGFGKVLQSCFF